MSSQASSVFVRELYPVARGLLWKTCQCPPVDWPREAAWSMDADGNVLSLADGGACNAAVRGGARVFALAKGTFPFSRTAVGVLKEGEWTFDFALSGELSVADAAKFLRTWAKTEGAFGVDGLPDKSLVEKVWPELEPVVRNELLRTVEEYKYRVAEIDERDVIPCATWKELFKQAGAHAGSLLSGLDVTVVYKRLVSPDREIERKRIAAVEAQRELEAKEFQAYQAAVNGKAKEAELESIDAARREARKQAELREAELEAAIARQRIDVEIYEQKNLNEERLRLQKALNDEEIRKADALRQGDKAQASAIAQVMEKMSQAESEATDRLAKMAETIKDMTERLKEMTDRLSKDGISVPACQQAAPVDPVVAPRYQGMSDQFSEVMAAVRAKSEDALAVSLRTAERVTGGGYATRSVFTSFVGTRDLLAGVAARPSTEGMRDVLRVGDRLTLMLRSARNGYLTLFNLGSSGRVLKMFPNAAFGTTANFIEANRLYSLPGELMDVRYLKDGFWSETGPVSDETGLPERVLAILTDDPVDLSAEALGGLTSRIGTRGGFAAVEEEISSIFDLRGGTWCHGFVEARVEN